jgi:hypothetical protein
MHKVIHQSEEFLFLDIVVPIYYNSLLNVLIKHHLTEGKYVILL